MPHVPDSVHATHDLELVAAFAAGDATGPDLARAETLVASCAECATLHADLRAIAAALPAVPVPARPRDFRITAGQAATLRPRGLRGLLAAFSGPRFAFATPLGTGLAALGIVGVLVASGGLPLAGTGSPTAQEAPQVEMNADQAGSAAASMDPALPPVEMAVPAPSGPATAGPASGTDGQASEAPASTVPDTLAGGAAPVASPEDRLGTTSAAPESTAATNALPDDGSGPLLVPAAGLVLAGLVLLVVRLTARRLA